MPSKLRKLHLQRIHMSSHVINWQCTLAMEICEPSQKNSPSSTSSTQTSPGTVNHIGQTSFPCLKNQQSIRARPTQHSFPGSWLWSAWWKTETARASFPPSPVPQLLRPAVSSHPPKFPSYFLRQLLASEACNSLAHRTSQTDLLKHVSISSVCT